MATTPRSSRVLAVLANLNWWSVTAVLMVLCMFGCLLSPEWPDQWAAALGFTAVVAAIFSLPDRE